MPDDVVGILPEDEIDEGVATFGPSPDDLFDDEGVLDVDALSIVPEDVVVEEEVFAFPVEGFGDDSSTPLEVEKDEDDDEEDFYGGEDDEARYNFRPEENPLDEAY